MNLFQKNPLFALYQSKNRWLNLKNKKTEKYLQYRGIPQKHRAKLNPSFHQSVSMKLIWMIIRYLTIMKTWPKGTKCICCWFNCPRFAARPAIPKAQRWSKKLFWRQCYTNVKPVLPHNLKHIILHVGTNNALTLPPNLILDKTLESKIKIEETNKDCKVTILTSTYRFDNRKPGNTVSELANMLINLNFPIVNNKNNKSEAFWI